MFALTDWPINFDLTAFAAAAVIVWHAGMRLTAYVDRIAEQTGIGHAFTGMLLLGGITLLPEIATVVTSSSAGNAPLALNNLIGSAAVNALLLGIADAVLGRDALTAAVAEPATLLQGTLGIILLVILAAGITAGEVAVLGVGFASTLLFILCVGEDREPDAGDLVRSWWPMPVDAYRVGRDGQVCGREAIDDVSACSAASRQGTP